jgi:bifunctional ADP-heptose synthase (sugar kinase/adenylyltransferase)
MVVFQRRSQERSSPEWSGRLRSEQLPAFAEHATDRLGCGDALLAATTLALTAGADLFHAAYLGNAAAAVEIGLLGNHPISAQTLRDWLKGRRELQTAEEASSAIPVPLGI